MSENGKTAAAGSTAEKTAQANGKHGGFAVGKLWPIIAQTEGRLKALFQTASTAFAVSQISIVNQLKKKYARHYRA
ncbi:hypothetical protein [Neisseria dentiae]|uniref:hypothetical protein n=1 Tax=Neisseria dentiae TaxID=194197 RepID=UPI0035A19B47